MSKVLITRLKLDGLAASISAKSGEALPLTLEEMKDAVDGIQTGGGSAISVVDISDTTAVASDVAQGKYFYTAQGVKTAGTASGGGGITTASLTFSAWSTTPFNLYAPQVVETYAKMSGVTEYLTAGSNPQTVNILLYNGASYVHIDNTIESMSGDIEEDEDGYYFITGDCSIIIS